MSCATFYLNLYIDIVQYNAVRRLIHQVNPSICNGMDVNVEAQLPHVSPLEKSKKTLTNQPIKTDALSGWVGLCVSNTRRAMPAGASSPGRSNHAGQVEG